MKRSARNGCGPTVFCLSPCCLALVSLSGRGSRVSGKFYSKMEYVGLKLELMSGYLLF